MTRGLRRTSKTSSGKERSCGSGRAFRHGATSRLADGKPRVLVVHHSTVLGGAEISLRTHMERARGCVYALAMPDHGCPPPIRGIADRATLTVPASYRGWDFFTAPARLIRSVVSLTRVIRRFRPNLIVAYASMSMPVVVAASRITRTPSLWHARELMSWRFPARLFARMTSRIVVPSESMARSIASRIASADRWKIKIVPSPIDARKYARPASAPPRGELRKTLGLPVTGRIVLLVGQHSSWKGHDDLVKAFPVILERVPDLHLLLLGGPWTAADRSYSRRMQRRAREYVEQGRVLFHPPSPAVEMYYWAADLLVLPSRREPFGRVVLEAISAGLPAVVSEDAGVASHVARISPGLLFKPADPASLASAVIAALTADFEVKRNWIRRGRAILEADFSADVVVPAIEEVYLETAARPGRG